MTEDEWMTCENLHRMLRFLKDKASDRQLRLFAYAACLQVGSHSANKDKAADAIATARRYLDGPGDDVDLIVAHAWLSSSFESDVSEIEHDPDWWFSAWGGGFAHLGLSEYPPGFASIADLAARFDGVRVIRDIFGNPFRPSSLDPLWLTSTVVPLAHQMYNSDDFSAMPVLADALQDAGCDNEEVLSHCRSDGPHVRGCWVVDSLLARR